MEFHLPSTSSSLHPARLVVSRPQKGEMSMAKRRGNHEGSIYRRKDGLWCAQVSLNGHRLTKYGKSQSECRDWIKQTQIRIEGGLTYNGTHLTLARFLDGWLHGKELARRPSTVNGYRRYAGLYIIPKLGKERLQDILPAHIKQLYALMKQEGRGARTIQLVHVTLHAAFKQAVREGYLGRNPLEAVDRPKVEQMEFKILTGDQVRQLLIAASGSAFETLFYLALTTGMRKGELLGLKWSDLDQDKGVLHIQRQLQQIPRKGFSLVPTKTKAGRRLIKLGQGTLLQLAAHRERQVKLRSVSGDQWPENDLIFTTGVGTFLDQSKVSKELKRLLQKAGLPSIRFHDLRHTSISFLLGMGTPVNAVQHRAGHSKASVTTDVYGHSLDESQEAAAEKIEELVTPIAGKLR
jgi:integrase